MKPRKSTLMFAAAFLAAGLSTHATVVFENTGTTTGWSYITQDGNGTVTQVGSPAYKGSTAIKATQVWLPGGDQSVHSEVVKRDLGQNGWDRYYGWAVYLPSTLPVDTSVRDQIMQLAADTACGGQQTEVLIYSGTQLRMNRTWGDPCNESSSAPMLTSSLSRGVWHRIVLRKKWASDNTGQYQIWLDGVSVFSEVNKPNSYVGSHLYRWSLGEYAVFHGTPVSNTRTVYIDHIRCASSYSEAEPANWSEPGVRFYSSVNYSGTASQVLAKGTYTMSQLAALGVANDSASSVRIPAGWTVTIYQSDNFGGTSWVRTADTPDFTAISGLNDTMSSCRIE